MTQDSTDALVTVTGASGFIAMHCIRELLAAGYQVRGTLRTPARGAAIVKTLSKHVDVGDRLEFVAADLTKDDGWDAAMAGATYLLHVASPLPRKPPKHENDLIDPARDGAVPPGWSPMRGGRPRPVGPPRSRLHRRERRW